MTDRSMVDAKSKRSTYRPYLVASSCPAYCCAHGWIAVGDSAGIDRIYYVERVERPWRDQNGQHITQLGDGSRRKFQPETPESNGRNPCLLFIIGEPQPWYYDSGWDNVRSVSFGTRGSDD